MHTSSEEQVIEIPYLMTHYIGYAHLDTTFQRFVATIDSHRDPQSYREAVNDQKWCDIMNIELQALEDNCTWDITNVPTGRRHIGCKWLFKILFKADDSVERHKARLVVLGNSQKYGVDYQETFAPIAK